VLGWSLELAITRGLVTGFLLRCFLALVVALVWARLDRRKTHEGWIQEGFFLVARFVVASELLGYGIGNKLGVHFSFGPPALITPFGEHSDYAFEWLGYSPAFDIFAGIAEVSGAVFLLFRRTMTLGAILATAAMVNVFAVTVEGWGPGSLTSGEFG